MSPTKILHFAGEARVTDAADMRQVGDDKRLALIISVLHIARMRARDDVATMFCKRIAVITKRAKEQLGLNREKHRADAERLMMVFGDILGGVRDVASPDDAESDTERRVGRMVLETLASAGGVAKLSREHEEIAAHHGNNHAPLMERFYSGHRAALFTLLEVLHLEATSADRAILDAIDFIRANRHRTGEFVPDNRDGKPLDLSFASEMWHSVVRDRRRPGSLVRRHLEVCVFSYLASELRSGDVAVIGSESYANMYDQMLRWEDCAPLVADYCAEAGIPATAREFVASLKQQLTDVAERVDREYPDNADLLINDDGVPVLKRRRGKERRRSALVLEKEILDRLPEWGLLDILARTAHWVEWHRHFGPASGSDPKIADTLGRYVLLTFTYGTNLGPAQVARHMRGRVSAHELLTALKHATPAKIAAASADVINEFAKLDLTRVWGDGRTVGTDGTQIDTWENNLLAETSIRYGGYGGIAYRHIADTYAVLFSRFIPCGVWEAVYIIEGLLENKSDVHPEVIHGDTQGQSLPVFGLSHLLGFELLPRIRNWKDLIFYRPDADTRYRHVDTLFGADAVIDWKLIETHWTDLMRTVVSIREGTLNSATLLRRLGNDSRKNRLYRALRELGRAVRTIVLLRYLSDPELRDCIAVITNRVEASHGFSLWLLFGKDGILADNDPDHHEVIVKFNELLSNCGIYHTALDITAVVAQLVAEGRTVNPDDLATITPYVTSKIRRFGDWVLDVSPPPAVAPVRLSF